MPTQIDTKKLSNVKGLNEVSALAIVAVYATFEELSGASAEDLLATVNGIDEAQAKSAIAFAKVQAKAVALVAPPPPAPPTGPQVIHMVTGKPEDMRIRDLLQAVADGERSSDFISVLQSRVGNKPVFVRDAEGNKLDVKATMEVIEFSMDTKPPETWDNRPTESLEDVLDVRSFANPLTGEKLAKGNAWLSVPEERRKLAIYGRLSGRLTGNEDPFALIEELKHEQFSDRWTPINAAWKQVTTKGDPIVAAVEAALYYRRGRGNSSGTRATF